MSKILKHSSVVVDNENRVTITVPPIEINEPEREEFSLETSKEISKEDYKSLEERARAEADKIMRKAKFDADLAYQEAMKRAKADALVQLEDAKANGYDQGMANAKAEADRIIDEAEYYKQSTIDECERAKAQLEPQMVEMVVRVIEKLLGDLPTVEPKVISYLIKKGLSETSGNGDMVIHVSPEDFDDTLANKAVFMPFEDGAVKYDIVKDSNLNKFDCFIETPYGNIDCSLDQQFDELRKNIYLILENR